MFGRDAGGDPHQRAAAVQRIKAELRQALGLSDDDIVMVTELACSEPGCPPRETVMALLRAEALTQRWKVHKPLIDVTPADVVNALASPGAHESKPPHD
jgi:hypothetical protein